MASGVFLIQADGQLVEMSEENYGQEADFQELLAKYPNLLAGNLVDGLWTTFSLIRMPFLP